MVIPHYLRSIFTGWGILLIGALIFGWAQLVLSPEISMITTAPALYMLKCVAFMVLVSTAIIMVCYGVYFMFFQGGLESQTPIRGWTIPTGVVVILVGLWWRELWRPFISLFPEPELIPMMLPPGMYYLPAVTRSAFILGFVGSGYLQVILGVSLISLSAYDIAKFRIRAQKLQVAVDKVNIVGKRIEK